MYRVSILLFAVAAVAGLIMAVAHFRKAALPRPALAVLHDLTLLERAESSRRDFIANVSHELRTPLTSIQGYVETLAEDPDPNPETTREFLGIIQKNATRMSRLTEDLLALASVESPDYKLALQPAKASALVEDAIDSLGGLVVDSGIELRSNGAPDVQVLADPDAMNQVFGNLIENALKYAKSGKQVLVGAQHHAAAHLCHGIEEGLAAFFDVGSQLAGRWIEFLHPRHRGRIIDPAIDPVGTGRQFARPLVHPVTQVVVHAVHAVDVAGDAGAGTHRGGVALL